MTKVFPAKKTHRSPQPEEERPTFTGHRQAGRQAKQPTLVHFIAFTRPPARHLGPSQVSSIWESSSTTREKEKKKKKTQKIVQSKYHEGDDWEWKDGRERGEKMYYKSLRHPALLWLGRFTRVVA